MMSVKSLLICLLLSAPAAFADGLSCRESPKSIPSLSATNAATPVR
ncbi:hypothetical protein [Neisseria elongata]|nr:hypothetical protein [Neisseria elongata]